MPGNKAMLKRADGTTAETAYIPTNPLSILIEGHPGLGPIRAYVNTHRDDSLGPIYVEVPIHFVTTREASPLRPMSEAPKDAE